MGPSLSYRPHLDGLRGVAVLLVFVFHAARPGLPGGFIGVDVFFVLSGYLITRILLTEYESRGTIDFTRFYARRVRRLMPAVVIVAVVVALREWLFAEVLDLSTRFTDVIATLFYFMNWNLILQADQYFLESAGASPLRHAWSLSIEEQFYLVWPVALFGLLVASRRWKKVPAVVTVALVLISAALMARLFEPNLVDRAYYGTDTRAHQPLIGAVLAFLLHRRPEEGEGGRVARWALVAIAGVLGLLAAARLLDGGSAPYFLWGGALVAVMTAILIMALEIQPEAFPARMLSWNPLRELGRISYGFYLWHWPIILWLQVPEGFSFLERRILNAAQFGLTLALSLLSFYAVEDPVRRGKVLAGRLRSKPTIAFGIIALVAAAAASLVALRPPSSDLALAAMSDRSYEPCPENPLPCVKVEGRTPDSPTVVLIGDSTAQSYDPALKQLAAKYGFRYVQAAVGGCPISQRLLATGIEGELHKPSNIMCYEQLPVIYEIILSEYDPELIIATSWNETNQHVENGQLLQKGTPEHLRATANALRTAVEYLTSQGARLAFVEVLPPGKTVECLSEQTPDACIRPVTEESGEGPYNAMFRSIADDLGSEVVSISLVDLVCPHSACPLVVRDLVMRYDGGHFTATASRDLAPFIDARLKEAGMDLSDLD